MTLRAAAFVLPLVVAVVGWMSAQSPPETVVETTSGQVSGIAIRDGVVAYLGIPYAAPQVGALRWSAPQPALSWTGVRAAAKYGPPCFQRSGQAPLLI